MIPELENEGESVKEEQPLGAVSRKQEHYKISRRDTLVNDLKNSTAEGLLSFGLSLFGFLMLIAAVLISYYQQGQSRAVMGLIPVFALLVSGFAVVFSILGFRRKDKVRHYMEKRGLVISIITIALLIALYVRGAVLYFGR